MGRATSPFRDWPNLPSLRRQRFSGLLTTAAGIPAFGLFVRWFLP
jgi:hypothetical protein